MEMQDALMRQILVLDGGLGTMIQRYRLGESDFRGDRFLSWGRALSGDHDILPVTCPDVIRDIHLAYLEAGADIIETCSFGANGISQQKYGLSEHVGEMNREAARLARSAVEAHERRTGKHCWVAGAVGPGGVSLSMPSRVEDAGYREVDFDALSRAYGVQIDHLIAGGVDAILFETFFDALNLKAGIYAYEEIVRQKNVHVPLMISVSPSDLSGRLLNGQTLLALLDTVLGFKPLSFGLNCSFGAEGMGDLLEAISPYLPCALSCYPNAGLPDADGHYGEDAGRMACCMASYARAGLVNIVGGCCGTTPQHIRALAEKVKNMPPRLWNSGMPWRVGACGLEALEKGAGRLIVAERANVTGSKKFKRLIESCQYEDALEVTRAQMDSGAQLIDICMDDAMLDARHAMREFVCRLNAEPEIARYPLVIDSSDFEVICLGLKSCIGRAFVNSLSLKSGESLFLAQADEVKRLGGNVIVMAFDEHGQASTTERRIEILTRAVYLLKERLGFSNAEIVLDPNILAIGTGLKEHSGQALSFIEACRALRARFNGIGTIGGLSNLSFSFRGRDDVRNAIHRAFLSYAGQDLTMVIANPAALCRPVDSELLRLAQDLVLCREGALEALLSWMDGHALVKEKAGVVVDRFEGLSPENGILRAFLRGIGTHLEGDVRSLLQKMTPLELIEGPLMGAMNEVGERFGRGEMYLPQIIKAARLMKQAIGYVEFGEDRHAFSAEKKKVLLATVWGDVHDIGKNIVNIVLACNGYEVIDLGVMVPADRIVESALRYHVDAIGLSALITPSLQMMVETAKALKDAGVRAPLLVGGAAVNEAFVAIKLEPVYAPGIVGYTGDASRVPGLLSKLLSLEEGASQAEALRERYRSIADLHEKRAQAMETLDAACREAAQKVFPLSLLEALERKVGRGRRCYAWRADVLEGGRLYDYVCRAMRVSLKNREAYGRVCRDVGRLLKVSAANHFLETRGVMKFVRARPDGEWIEIRGDSGEVVGRLGGGRALGHGSESLALSDFVSPDGGAVGLFALTTPLTEADIGGLCVLLPEFDREYVGVLAQAVATSLVDIANDRLQEIEVGKLGKSIAVAPGYPICPDHGQKAIILSEVLANEIGICLTESTMMTPLASICGFTIVHPEIRYFSV